MKTMKIISDATGTKPDSIQIFDEDGQELNLKIQRIEWSIEVNGVAQAKIFTVLTAAELEVMTPHVQIVPHIKTDRLMFLKDMINNFINSPTEKDWKKLTDAWKNLATP